MGVKKLDLGEATAYYRSTELRGQGRSGRVDGIGIGVGVQAEPEELRSQAKFKKQEE